ncbi:MAG: excinuclease ABC subunit UvrC [Peptococcaceae bacterium]|nr:excinuclease ABC subunit UvrC [Peptococcaceae bacterium]
MLQETLRHLPDRPGVYLFKDSEDKIIYVGKAVSLKNRVRSYFHATSGQSPKVALMMEKAADLEYIITDSEIEALILESNLIKTHYPRYNILLRDDKSYPFLKVTLGEDFPRVHITRRVLKDGAKYFGPYTRVGAVNETLKLIGRLFPLRTCRDKILQPKSRPCLNYHIGRCLAPCAGLVDKENYRARIKEVILFLEGRQEEVVKKLRDRMEQAAENMEFELAARLRDQIIAIEEVLEKQKIVSCSGEDQDIVAAVVEQGQAAVMVFFVRGGKLLGRDSFSLKIPGDESAQEVVNSFLKQYYHSADFIPGEILISSELDDEAEVLSRWLSEKKGTRVHIRRPKRGEKRKLVEMAAQNAQMALEEALLRAESIRDGSKDVTELGDILGLIGRPVRMECYDISNIQGAETVASMAVFVEGRPATEEYRHFKIKTVVGQNDFAAMHEVLDRRFRRSKEEKELIRLGLLSTKKAGFSVLPDLVIVDGGKGQLSAAREAMEKNGVSDIPLFALAKEEELIFKPGEEYPLRLPIDSKALYLLQRIRDEAHRFAVAYHRQLRTKRNLKSLLDEIEGVGKVRKRALLKAYPTIQSLAEADVDDLAGIPGMNRKTALEVAKYFETNK